MVEAKTAERLQEPGRKIAVFRCLLIFVINMFGSGLGNNLNVRCRKNSGLVPIDGFVTVAFPAEVALSALLQSDAVDVQMRADGWVSEAMRHYF